jgi:hypothetical protein
MICATLFGKYVHTDLLMQKQSESEFASSFVAFDVSTTCPDGNLVRIIVP